LKGLAAELPTGDIEALRVEGERATLARFPNVKVCLVLPFGILMFSFRGFAFGLFVA